MYKILAINFSQSGQLTAIVDNFLKPLSINENISIDRIVYDHKEKFPFPWTSDVFFNTMPESILEEPRDLEEIVYQEEKYDLVILGYQPWFLSPSIPTSSLLQNTEFKKRIKNTEVITLIGSRNMWINGQESVKKHLTEAKAKLIGNIPLIDHNNNSISAITILYWMLTGKKESFLGIFPKPGVLQSEIDDMSSYGDIFLKAKENNQLSGLQGKFRAKGNIDISNNLMFVELRGRKLFKIWANFIKSKKSSRKFWVSVYKYYLLVALFLVAPILLIILNVFIFPFTKDDFKKKKSYFCGVELK